MTAETETTTNTDSDRVPKRPRRNRSASWRRPTIALLVALVFAVFPVFVFLRGEAPNPVLLWGAVSLAVLSVSSLIYMIWRLGVITTRLGARRHLISTIANRPRAQLLQRRDTGVYYANAAFYEVFEALTRIIWTRDIGIDAVAALIVGDAKQQAFGKLRASADACRYDHAVLELRVGPEETVWWQFTTEPIGGHPGLALWTIDDHTADHVVESGRMQEEMLLADLLEYLPVGYFSADSDGNMQYVNTTLANWLGVPPQSDNTDRAEPLPFSKFVLVDEDAEEILPAVSDESGLHGAVTLKDSEGEPFPAYLIQSEHQDESGAFTHSRSLVLREPFIPVVDDGTGRAVIKRFPWLFAEAPVGMVLLDLGGNVTECNRAFLKLLGLHRDGVIGRPLSERIVKEDRSDVSGGLSKVVMGTIRATFLDVRMPAAGERELAASLYVSPMHDAEDEISGLVVHIIDTTEQKSLEIQFNQSQKMQAVGQLAGGVAHDFNNLLTAMIGFCDLLLGRHGSGDPSFADIMQIKQNANRAANLVRQLLAFSRRQTLQPRTFGVTNSLNDLSNLLRRLIGENIELDMKHGDDLDLIRTDPGQFDQVIINLVVNARDAMPGGGMISISSEMVNVETPVQRGHEVVPAGRYVTISVSDTGAGIAKEDIGHIFEPFFSTKEVGEGTGLGLSTVYGIIRQSDGFIFVDSAMGEGAAFSIFLPAHTAPARPEGAAAETQTPSVEADLTGGGTVLLVEDEDAVRTFGSRALRNKGYRVLEASDGEMALDVINGNNGEPIDLIITDVMMPGMDGHTLVRLVQEEMPEVKIILMSGYAEEAIPGELDEESAIHFLPKPFSLQELAVKVKDVMLG